MSADIKPILKWLTDVGDKIIEVKKHEATVSKRQLLRVIYALGDDVEQAIAHIAKGDAL